MPEPRMNDHDFGVNPTKPVLSCESGLAGSRDTHGDPKVFVQCAHPEIAPDTSPGACLSSLFLVDFYFDEVSGRKMQNVEN